MPDCGMTNSTITQVVLATVFTAKLIKQFPGDASFGKLFEEANCKCQPAENLMTYCLKKLGKIPKLRLEIPEHKVANFVADGICDNVTHTMVLDSGVK